MGQTASTNSIQSTVSRSIPRTVVQSRGYWADAWRRIRRDKLALAGGTTVLALLLIAVLAQQVAPYDPLYQHADGLSEAAQPLPANSKFLLGTDRFGRDVLSRLIFGARISLTVGILGNSLALLIGTLVGAVAGFIGGWVESILMRLTDIILGIPMLFLAMALVAAWEPSLSAVIIVIAIAYWTYLARVIHGEVLRVREMEYITAARAVGVPTARILVSHVMPQMVSIVLVYLSLGVSTTIMLEASLSFLGLGVPAPAASWGSMVSEGQAYFRLAPWLVVYPGLAVLITVLGFNLLGDGLRDALDPTSSEQ